MTLMKITVLIITILSISLTSAITVNILKYRKKYKMPENKHSRLFRIITKEAILVFYIIFTILHLIFSSWIIWII